MYGKRPVVFTPAMNPNPERARMPRQLPFIIANEGCERFSFYGMRNILKPFLTATLLAQAPMPSAAAKDVFHTFVFGVYFFPLLGAFIADRFFGKYNTILWFSLIYCAGHGCLAMWDDNVTGFYTGLFLIAFGAGGIKPLVASFMGDQFDQRNKHLAKLAFDAFYWIINFGSFFASLLMPLLLDDPKWAFGIPGILMFIATVAFWLGHRYYVIVPPAPRNPHSFSRVIRTALVTRAPDGSRWGLYIATAGVVLFAASFLLLLWLDLVPVFGIALITLVAFGGIGTSMQLDRALAHHPEDAVAGVRSVLRILIVFALITPFWSLFDQKATEWVDQGKLMEKPEWFHEAQMQALNPALVMILIPFNNIVLFPWLRRLGFELTQLRKMGLGIALAGCAWVVTAVFQLIMDGGTSMTITWQLLPYILLTLGEVLVSATGLEFAYSQAPMAMKGVIMSFWNLGVSIGNVWVLLVNAAIRNESVLSTIEDTGMSTTAFLMFFFAGFAFLAALAFKLYTRRYTMLDMYRKVPEDAAKRDPAAAPIPEARDVSSRKDPVD
jgi:POT family proton-dependent oligopeptide transporter